MRPFLARLAKLTPDMLEPSRKLLKQTAAPRHHHKVRPLVATCDRGHNRIASAEVIERSFDTDSEEKACPSTGGGDYPSNAALKANDVVCVEGVQGRRSRRCALRWLGGFWEK